MALCASLFAFSTAPAYADEADFEGIWLFDDAPSYPGVTMMEVTEKKGEMEGTVTSEWYGPMEMQDIAVEGDRMSFTMRNLNDKEHPTRIWHAERTPQGVHLTGTVWHTEHEEDGYRGTKAQAEKRRFKLTTLPQAKPLPFDGRSMTPPMGWSSWNKFAEDIDDATVRAMADALVETGLRDAGYIYVNIDDGWQGERAADGSIQPNDKFPDMKALADYVHARGLKLGLYSSQGPKTCAGYEGSYGHVEQDAETFAEWGIDYLKYDLCSGEWFYDTRDTVLRSYYEMGKAIRETGRPMLYSICEYGRFDVGNWGRQVGGHLWRTTGDIVDEWPVMEDIGFNRNPKKPEYSGPGGWNDPDMLEIGNGGMSHEEYQTHMTLWAMSAAPLILGHDLRETSDDALALLTNREVIAIDQDARGEQGVPLRKDSQQEVWTKPLSDGSTAVALFNRGTAAARMAVRPEDIEAETIQGARNLWTHSDLTGKDLSFTVPAHGSVMLRVW
ncbi:glycoside hydrolase family 27 protein [Altericroceibacterium spongiae]|uniref:Alpha-galactosidase n=2 Tax=Altericroceibacterium spongiae TaxID=2320269 RepID=A0A420EE17_9SPHN|nr:glycoside hydrolase family 27 protein [Altericroceibacterium spongiae]